MTIFIARDMLRQVMGMPTASALWQHLTAVVDALSPEERAGMVAELSGLHFGEPAAAWLHYSAMANLSGDAGWLARQAALVEEHTSANAIMSLLLMAWHHAMVRTGSHAAFRQVLQQADAVRLLSLVALQLRDDGHAVLAAPLYPAVAMKRTPLRVAVYTPDMAHNAHGGTTLTLNMLSALASLGMEVRAFSGQESHLPAVGAYYGGWQILPQKLEPSSLCLHGQGDVDLKLAATGVSLPARMEELLALIHDYQPDLVLFVGYMSAVPYLLYQHYPVLGLSVHAVSPLVPLDVWLAPADVATDVNAVWPQLPRAQAAPFPCRFWPFGMVAPLPRASLQLSDDMVLMVTSGTRLEIELEAAWIGRMVDVLDAHPCAYWLVIGGKPEVRLARLPNSPRIQWLPSQNRLAQWLAMCDIYANPPRLGGGGTVAMAMEQGLAVAAYAATDGGDKTGSAAAESEEAYWAMLERWLYDGEARRSAGRAMQQRFGALLDMSTSQAGERLAEACRQAVQHFHQRKGGAID